MRSAERPRRRGPAPRRFAPLHDFDIPLAEVQRLAAEGAPEYGNYVMHWYDEYDIGLKGNWAAPELDDSNWKTVDIPGGFAELGVPDTPAVAWFRKEIVLPDPLPAGRALVFLGSIERMDTVYINGQVRRRQRLGGEPARLFPSEGVLKPGPNVIAIRVLKTKPDGGFLGKPEELHLMLGDKTSIPLAGKWKGQAQRRRSSAASAAHRLRELAGDAGRSLRRNAGAHRAARDHRRPLVSGRTELG